jgi:heptosyltransferase I
MADSGVTVEFSLNQICIVMMSAIGDTVHVLPVVNAIKRAHPSCKITWILQPGPASLVRSHPNVDEILEVDPRKIASVLALRRTLRNRRFDLVLDLQVALKAGIITSFTRAPIKLGFDKARARDLNWLFTTHKIPPHPRQHVQDQYFEFLQFLGISPEPVEYNLGPHPSERVWQEEFYSRFTRPVAAIVAGTSNPDRDWLPERWATVSDRLYEQYGMQTVIVGGPSPRERATADHIAARTAHPPVIALGTGLRKLVAILDRAELVLSPDTGPMHIAVALNRPTIALMANADPRRTGPYRRFQDLIVDAFRHPSDGDEIIWERRPGRTENITVEQVMDRVAHWAAHYRTAS